MSAVIAIIILLVLFVGLTTFSIVNAVRIKRHMNKSVTRFRTQLENEANSVLDDLFKADGSDDRLVR